jgi:hypothetical protein
MGSSEKSVGVHGRDFRLSEGREFQQSPAVGFA